MEVYMNSSIKKYVIPMFIIVFIAVFGLSSTLSISKNSDITDAQLNLEEWQSSDFLLLNGEWEYFPNALKSDISGTGEFVTIPHLWEPSAEYSNQPYGYATYKMQLSGLDPDLSYALHISDLGMAYNLYVNDRLIMHNGVVSRDEDQFVPEWKSKVGVFYPDELGNSTIIVEISNFTYYKAGFWNPIQLGNTESMTSEHHERLLVESILFGWFAAIGLFFILLNALSKHEKKSLHLGVFSLLIGLRILVTGHKIILDLAPAIPWEIIVRADYMFGMFLFPVFGFLMFRMGYIKPLYWTRYVSYTLGVLAILSTVVLPIFYYQSFFQCWTYLISAISIYFVYMFAKSIYEKVEGVLFMFFIVIMLGTIAISEFFFGIDQLYLYYSIFIFVSYIAVMVADDFLTIKKKQLSLETRIIIDPLTNVYNRLYLNQLISHGYAKINPDFITYLLFVDINGFKDTNDQFGRDGGDEILITVASRLQNFIGKLGAVIRYGGDEFIVIFEVEKDQDIHDTIKDLHQLIEDRIHVFNQDYLMTAAIGYSLYDGDITLDDAIRVSDTHMYENKFEQVSHTVKYHD
ncbi:MAG TPA: hypothetical protein DEG42_01525 [Acholeplasmataceae bacterium]|nr:hypothetical protein [Acholeplasmataceae bacterium]